MSGHGNTELLIFGLFMVGFGGFGHVFMIREMKTRFGAVHYREQLVFFGGPLLVIAIGITCAVLGLIV